MGCGILATYPQIAAIAGVQGLLVYGLSSSLPILLFGFFGPIIRKRCPEGFVLTEWARQRYGVVTGLYLSFFTIATMFLYMVGELSSLQMAITTLTGMDALPVMIVECVVTTIYTSWGGFHTSFVTDNIQGAMVFILLIVCSIAMGVNIDVDRSVVRESPLLHSSLLGWQLVYILPVAIATNDFFLSGFWLRTFASKTNKDLFIGTSIGTVVILIFLVVTGVTGLIATWTGLLDDGTDSSYAFFIVLLQLPNWVVGFVLVFIMLLSAAVFDSLQSAMVSSISNDVFRNQLRPIWARLIVVLVMIPTIVVALRAPNVLQIFLISDLISAAVVPSLMLGLWQRLYFISGVEVIVSGLGGILTVFIFGTIYLGSALEGAKLIILENGLYVDDWSAFGAFVAAPFGGLIFGAITLVIRLSVLKIYSMVTGAPFTALDKPVEAVSPFAHVDGPRDIEDSDRESENVERVEVKTDDWRSSKLGSLFFLQEPSTKTPL
ncbi:hypothetical protein DV495_000797 [Geotrichum candidum]|uniref:Similar to Saccharomyces cerevisiae YHL016C DUR3 Plasma membrane transporter for both urea and polyamines n=1 Tax=Geotrichum candidum TaxID=1173061 RepID=A0A0J9XK82_GEOCN|nr:hypothetical protein DV454_002482 [Geotrichum candidum]KAI9213697.1 hypothetical protein DS838_001394 [Geotrichum bryndzae]KAF5120650.1 hypothetical protein DV452_001116 [Geotrichum candidum]KAF5135422.1 hypothetical protein DV495_000797 [Geotrichum candidum]KAF7499818.1 hypothetical protein DV113_002178 [Geotrichum candidum]